MLGVIIVLAAAVLSALPVIFAAAVALWTVAAVFSGMAELLAAGAYAGKGILLGIALGFIAYRAVRKTRTAKRAE